MGERMEGTEEENRRNPQDDGLKEYSSGPFRGLTRNVVRLGLVSFFADVSSEMLYPLVPIFLTQVLGAPIAVLGVIEGVAEATASLLKTVAGRMSDRSGRRRPYLIAGYALAAIAKPLLALAGAWPLVMVARVTDRFGKGLRGSPRDALLAESVRPAVRGRAFGWHRAMDTAGAVVGPLLALGLVSAAHQQLRLVFLLAFIPAIIGVALVYFVQDRRHPVDKHIPSIAYGALPPRFRAYLIGWGIFALANSTDMFLIMRAKDVFGHVPGLQAMQTYLVILVYAFYNVTYAIASPGLGHLSDRVGRRFVLVGGLLVFAVVYLGFGFASQAWQIWPLFAIYGLYMAATDGVGKAYAVDLVAPGIKASALGLLGTVTGVATLIASTVAGVLWTGFGPWAAFGYGALGALIGCALIARIRPQEMSRHLGTGV